MINAIYATNKDNALNCFYCETMIKKFIGKQKYIKMVEKSLHYTSKAMFNVFIEAIVLEEIATSGIQSMNVFCRQNGLTFFCACAKDHI